MGIQRSDRSRLKLVCKKHTCDAVEAVEATDPNWALELEGVNSLTFCVRT